MLPDTFGLIGYQVKDPVVKNRHWSVSGFFYPTNRYGLRVRLVDNRGFSTFINQRDFEHLIGMYDSGDECPWLDEPYVNVDSRQYVGFTMDQIDLQDDLYVREIEDIGFDIALYTEIERRIHFDGGDYLERLFLFEHSTEYERIMRRWISVETVKVKWTLTKLLMQY